MSPDEKAFALMEVVEGRVPKDRVALRELAAELADWPFLDAEPAKKSGPSLFAKAAGWYTTSFFDCLRNLELDSLCPERLVY